MIGSPASTSTAGGVSSTRNAVANAVSALPSTSIEDASRAYVASAEKASGDTNGSHAVHAAPSHTRYRVRSTPTAVAGPSTAASVTGVEPVIHRAPAECWGCPKVTVVAGGVSSRTGTARFAASMFPTLSSL